MKTCLLSLLTLPRTDAELSGCELPRPGLRRPLEPSPTLLFLQIAQPATILCTRCSICLTATPTGTLGPSGDSGT